MSFLFRWFGRKNESEDYEQILSSLALDIQNRQSRLSDIRVRERRSTLLTTLYTLALWVSYVSLWYANVLPNLSGHARTSAFEKGVKGAPVVVGPILILFIRRIVQLWYARIGDAEEKTLKTLLRQQRTKIEEIKKKTNYYTTRNLIERYDESPSDANSTLRRRNVQPGGPSSSGPQGPVTPQRPTQPSSVNAPLSKLQTRVPISPSLKNHLAGTPQPIQPLRKQWYDKLADALLGDDESTPTSSTSRYALICEKCFNHNGLVKESVWENTQYVCPKCGYFNASAQSKKSGSISSPNSPFPRSPVSPTAIPAHLHPNQGSTFVPPVVAKDQARLDAGEADDDNDGEHATEENQSVMEVDS